MLGQSGVEILDPLRGRLPGHGLSEVRPEAIEGIGVLEGLSEVLLESPDRLESGNIELLIIGAVGSLYIGVILPLPLPDAEELDAEEVKGSFLQPSQLCQTLPSKLLPPIGLEEELMGDPKASSI